jgi:hypothetical protein
MTIDGRSAVVNGSYMKACSSAWFYVSPCEEFNSVRSRSAKCFIRRLEQKTKNCKTRIVKKRKIAKSEMWKSERTQKSKTRTAINKITCARPVSSFSANHCWALFLDALMGSAFHAPLYTSPLKYPIHPCIYILLSSES